GGIAAEERTPIDVFADLVAEAVGIQESLTVGVGVVERSAGMPPKISLPGNNAARVQIVDAKTHAAGDGVVGHDCARPAGSADSIAAVVLDAATGDARR